MKLARTIMIQGTASSAGKSLLVTALCRLFSRHGLRVAPFKSQNMALNAAVTLDGREIGRAQAVQAEAAGVEPTVEMNPILLKPEANSRSQVVVRGRPVGSMSARDYHNYKQQLKEVVASCLLHLRERHDLVVIEGAGSPAEINLSDREIVNMHVARTAEAPVLLVGDIDLGGVFASLVGTIELLEPEARARVAAFIVNKFRGDIGLLRPGLEWLTRRTGIPVLGTVPHIPGLRIADEDSAAMEQRGERRRATTAEVDIAIVKLPRLSNYDDFTPLEHEPGVVVRYVETPDELPGADLVVLPGSKSTVADLEWLRQVGIAAALCARARQGRPILGVCGGCQMLGETIEDQHGVESAIPRTAGLDVLPLRTQFAREKITARVRARPVGRSLLWSDADAGVSEIEGYEIHAGEVTPLPGATPAFEILQRNGEAVRVLDGAVKGAVIGTLIHGVLENESVRAALLQNLRDRRGLVAPRARTLPSREASYDRLAQVVGDSLNWRLLCEIAGLDVAQIGTPVRSAGD